MADIHHLYFDGAFSGHYLLEIIPRSATALPGTPVIGVIQAGAITIEAPDAYGFREFPMGMQSTPVYKVTVHSWMLTSEQRAAILNYRLDGGGSVTGDTEFDYDLHTLWRIYTTDAEGVIERVIFEGTQRMNPTPDIDILQGYGATATYELHDVVKVAFEQISGAALSDRIREMDRSDVDGVDWSIIKAYCDIAWTAGGHRFALFGNAACSAAPLGFVLDALADMASQIYAGHCRTGATIDFKSVDGGGDSMSVQATPWDHWRFAKQNPDSSFAEGDELLAREIGFIGRIQLSLDGEQNAGILYPGQDSFGGKWSDCYALLQQMVEAAWGRAVVLRFDPGVVKVWFLGPNQSVGVAQEIDKTWLLAGKLGDLNRYKAKGGTPALASVDASTFGAMSKDQKSWKGTGVDGGKAFTVKCIFDNHPAIRDDSELSTTMISLTGGDQRRIYYKNVSPWKLVYIEDDVHGQQFIARVHPAVKINVGDNETPILASFGGYGASLPDYTGVEDGPMFNDLRARLAPVQGAGAYVAAVVDTALSYANSPNVSTYTFSIPYALYLIYEAAGHGIGCTLMLPEDGAGHRRAGCLVSDTDASLPWFGIGPLATVKPNLDTGTAEVTFIGVR